MHVFAYILVGRLLIDMKAMLMPASCLSFGVPSLRAWRNVPTVFKSEVEHSDWHPVIESVLHQPFCAMQVETLQSQCVRQLCFLNLGSTWTNPCGKHRWSSNVSQAFYSFEVPRETRRSFRSTLLASVCQEYWPLVVLTKLELAVNMLAAPPWAFRPSIVVLRDPNSRGHLSQKGCDKKPYRHSACRCLCRDLCGVFWGAVFFNFRALLQSTNAVHRRFILFVATDAIGFRTHTFRHVAEIARWWAKQRTAARKALPANTLQQWLLSIIPMSA